MTAPLPFISPFPGPNYAYDPQGINLNFGSSGPASVNPGAFNQGVNLNLGTNPAAAQAAQAAQAATGVPSGRFDQILQRTKNAVPNAASNFQTGLNQALDISGRQGPLQAPLGRVQQAGQMTGRGLNNVGKLGTNPVAAGLTALTMGGLAGDNPVSNAVGAVTAALSTPLAAKAGALALNALPGGRIIAPFVQAAVPLATAAIGSGITDKVQETLSGKNGANPVTEAVTTGVDRAINPNNLDNRARAASQMTAEQFKQLSDMYGESFAKAIALQEAGLLTASEVQMAQEKNRADLATRYRSTMIPLEVMADNSRTFATGYSDLTKTVANALGNLGTTALTAQANPYLSSRG